MSITSYAFYIAKGKASVEDCTDLETLELAEKIALKDAMQYARDAFKSEFIDGDYESAHYMFERSDNIANAIALHIERLVQHA